MLLGNCTQSVAGYMEDILIKVRCIWRSEQRFVVFLLLLNSELNESVVVVVDNLFGCSTRSSFKSKSENLLPAISPFYLLVSLSGSSFSLEVMFSINDTALQFSIRSWKSDYKLRSASQSNRRRSLNINSRVSDCSLNDMFGLKGEDCLIS